MRPFLSLARPTAGRRRAGWRRRSPVRHCAIVRHLLIAAMRHLLIAAKGSEFGVRSEAWEHEEPPRRQIGAKSGASAPGP
jgi:hypothetical protein